MTSDVERLVLEKHQLLAAVQQRNNLIVALARRLADDNGVVRVTKTDLDATLSHMVDVKPLKYGLKLTVQEAADDVS